MPTLELWSLLVSVATLMVLSWTLWVLRRYAKDTKRLADTAVEQLPRPYVVLKQSVDPSDEAIMNGKTTSLIGDNHYASRLVFWNVGTGPAVNCRYGVIDPTEKIIRGGPHFESLPEIAPSASFETPRILNSLPDTAEIIIEYKSVAGTPHNTVQTIEERRWVTETRST